LVGVRDSAMYLRMAAAGSAEQFEMVGRVAWPLGGGCSSSGQMQVASAASVTQLEQKLGYLSGFNTTRNCG
jgi:hypothetical protein